MILVSFVFCVFGVLITPELKNKSILKPTLTTAATPSELHDHNFRDSSLIDVIGAKSTMGQCSTKSAFAREWNSLPRNIQCNVDVIHINYLTSFKALGQCK